MLIARIVLASILIAVTIPYAARSQDAADKPAGEDEKLQENKAKLTKMIEKRLGKDGLFVIQTQQVKMMTFHELEELDPNILSKLRTPRSRGITATDGIFADMMNQGELQLIMGRSYPVPSAELHLFENRAAAVEFLVSYLTEFSQPDAKNAKAKRAAGQQQVRRNWKLAGRFPATDKGKQQAQRMIDGGQPRPKAR